MADTQQSYQSQQDQETDTRSQSDFNHLFESQVGSQSVDLARDAWTAYHDLAEQTLRTARRVSEMQVFQLMEQQIIRKVTSNVVQQIKSDPSLIKQIAKSAQQR